VKYLEKLPKKDGIIQTNGAIKLVEMSKLLLPNPNIVYKRQYKVRYDEKNEPVDVIFEGESK
jgi:hypothetical protein